jgi:hypothetical protein
LRILVLTLLCACNASIQPVPNGGADASAGSDARPTDAPPVDARPCAGGDAHASDSQGNCFAFFATPMLYVDAKAACELLPGHLATVVNQEQETLIENLRIDDAYLGATDQVTEGTFLWQDGSPLTFTHWRANEPNNGSGVYEEDCVVITNKVAVGWDDRPCIANPVGAGSYAYICEY